MRLRSRAGLFAGAAAVVILSLCGVGGWAVLRVADFPQAARELPAAEREYRALGLPWVASDLARDPAVAEGDNAAIPIREVVALAPFREPGHLDVIHDLLLDGRLDEAGERLQRYEGILPKVVEAARRPDADFGRDWDLGLFLDQFPEYVAIKAMVRLLVWDGRLKAGRGDSEGAAARLLEARRLASHVGRDPILIAHLVYQSCDSIALWAVADLLASHRGNAAELERLRAVSEADLYVPEFRDAVRGEGYFGIAAIRNMNYRQMHRMANEMTVERSDVDPANLRRDGAPRGLIERAFFARHLQIWSEAERVLSRHPDDLQAQSRVMQELGARLENERRLSYLMNSILLPVTGGGEGYVRREARERTVRAAARILEFEARHGRFPERLDEVGEVPMDPFVDEPLRYRRTEDGFRVYSVGPSRRDHGGHARGEPRDADADDEVVAYPPPQRNRRP
jgi:hypothetical protein